MIDEIATGKLPDVERKRLFNLAFWHPLGHDTKSRLA
jgi:hypothetical protein